MKFYSIEDTLVRKTRAKFRGVSTFKQLVANKKL